MHTMCHQPRARVRRRSQLLMGLSRDPRSSHTTWMLHLRAYQSHSSLMHQPDFSTCMLQKVRGQRPCLLPTPADAMRRITWPLAPAFITALVRRWHWLNRGSPRTQFSIDFVQLSGPIRPQCGQRVTFVTFGFRELPLRISRPGAASCGITPKASLRSICSLCVKAGLKLRQ
jgi:hypothetical protein